jgi:lactoylglutathione lyase
MPEPQQSPTVTGERRQQDPQSLRLRRLTPSVTVDDIDRSMRFYVDGLGFTVKERDENEGKLVGAMLVAGSVELGIGQDDWAKGRNRKKGVGFRLYAETTQDLDSIAARARKQGIEVDGPKDSSWGSRIVTFTDPDGFVLTIHSAKQ